MPRVLGIPMDNGVEEGNTYSSFGECLGIIIPLRNLEMFNPIANQVNADKKDILLYIKLANVC